MPEETPNQPEALEGVSSATLLTVLLERVKKNAAHLAWGSSALYMALQPYLPDTIQTPWHAGHVEQQQQEVHETYKSHVDSESFSAFVIATSQENHRLKTELEAALANCN